MKNKLSELHLLLYTKHPKLVLITESWLSQSKGITDNLLDPEQQFTIYRCDRENSVHGGGVCAFVNKTVKTRQFQIPDKYLNLCTEAHIEILCFDIHVNKNVSRIILVYRPPNSSFGKTDHIRGGIKSLNIILNELIHLHHTTYICGDFNLPNINWLNNCAAFDDVHDVFYEFLSSMGMTQFILQPTRHSSFGTNNILDLIFSNDPFSVTVTDIGPPLSSSDHAIIEFTICLPNNSNNNNNNNNNKNSSNNNNKNNANHEVTTHTIHEGSHDSIDLPVYDWSSVDYDSVAERLGSVDWHNLFGFNFDADTIWDNFKKIIWPIIDLYIPRKLISHNKKYKTRKYPKQIHRLLNRKAAIWRLLKKNKTLELQNKYDRVTCECKAAIYAYDVEREKKILNSNNLGAFYKFVNRKLSSSTGVSTLLNPEGILISADIDKANLLNGYFESVFIQDNGILPPFPSRFSNPTHDTISDIQISPAAIQRTLSNLKLNSAAGPDGIPPIFFHKVSRSIIFPLSTMFRTFIDLRTLPQEWKHSIIAPKFKKGDPSNPSNYRPIALTCTCCKILESIISSNLIEFLLANKLINKNQHGFLKRHSTSTNLLESLNDWSLAISNRKSVVIGYIDFQRAFDSISHAKLIAKLQSYGISGNLLYWIKSFLSDRIQSVRIGSTISTFCRVISGVPQGSVLGPTLFILFINDISDAFQDHITFKLFADDIKLYTDLSLPSASKNFQAHLDLVQDWAFLWQIGISYHKCSIIELGPHHSQTDYTLSSNKIQTTDKISDLGIQIQSNLKFNTHINEMVIKAHQRASLIFRSFLSRDIENLIRAFKTYIRPLVEYASPVWSPAHLVLIGAVEAVQRRFTKRLPGMVHLSYAERLAFLKLQSLEQRRLITDLITCFNIIHGHTSLTFSEFFTFSHNKSSRGHGLRLEIPVAKSNSRKHFFSCRVINAWNSLPSVTVIAHNTKSFKYQLYKLNLGKYTTQPWIVL